MKKVFSALMAVVLVVGCLTGCSNKKAFEQSEIIRVLEKHGFEEVKNYSRLYSDDDHGYYYVPEDEDEANSNSGFYHREVKSLLYAVVTEDLDGYNRSSYLEIYNFTDSSDAEEVFENYVDSASTQGDVEFAEKDGYQYVYYAEDDEPLIKYAAYLCGNTVLVIQAYCLEDGKTGFGSYIFKELGLVEPKVKD